MRKKIQGERVRLGGKKKEVCGCFTKIDDEPGKEKKIDRQGGKNPQRTKSAPLQKGGHVGKEKKKNVSTCVAVRNSKGGVWEKKRKIQLQRGGGVGTGGKNRVVNQRQITGIKEHWKKGAGGV